MCDVTRATAAGERKPRSELGVDVLDARATIMFVCAMKCEKEPLFSNLKLNIKDLVTPSAGVTDAEPEKCGFVVGVVAVKRSHDSACGGQLTNWLLHVLSAAEQTRLPLQRSFLQL